jgi:hypothetical protein
MGSLAQFVYEELREQLITREMPPGQPRHESELAKAWAWDAPPSERRSAVWRVITRLFLSNAGEPPWLLP